MQNGFVTGSVRLVDDETDCYLMFTCKECDKEQPQLGFSYIENFVVKAAHVCPICDTINVAFLALSTKNQLAEKGIPFSVWP